ncbi:MAG TPA: hypothetical protein DER02_01090 [Gammaproteobacteria bacterium]|nr:hypothetical protein [Gammaproteobacteria bacterium]
MIDGLKWASKHLLVVALFFVGLELTRETLARLSGREGIFAVLIWLAVMPIAFGLVLFAR